MKNKAITILLILNLITTTGILNFLIKGQISKEKEIIKEMSESEQVSGLQTQIDGLNESHEEYAKNVQSYKRQIASAITDMGVETLETANVDTMTNNIRSISVDSTEEEISYPDYENGVQFNESKTSYTAPSNGWLYIYTDASTSGNAAVLVNGHTVGTTPYNTARTYFFPVKANDVITINGGGTMTKSSTLYPSM